MTQKLAALLCLLFCLNLASAQQSFSLSPNPVIGTPIDDTAVEALATFSNLSSSTVTFQWTRVVLQMDPDTNCILPVTDPYLHWVPSAFRKNFTLEPNQEGPLGLTLYDFDQTGCCAIVLMKVKRLTPPEDSLEGIYQLRDCQLLADSEPDAPGIQLFPNPATHWFALQHAEKVAALTLFNADGRLIRRMEARPDQHYPLITEPAGQYYLVLENTRGETLRVLEFFKQ
ncbi:MAG: T9SS type A sorting domain-containing protein [Saprospiraceae bacterium]|nr:T9SS type A sorting domain-containing protein [Saprospiraceae bacterium]